MAISFYHFNTLFWFDIYHLKRDFLAPERARPLLLPMSKSRSAFFETKALLNDQRTDRRCATVMELIGHDIVLKPPEPRLLLAVALYTSRKKYINSMFFSGRWFPGLQDLTSH